MSQNDNKKKQSYYSSLVGFNRAVPIILWALAAFLTFCFIVNDTGSFGRAISEILLGLFSYGAFIIPALLALHAVFYPSDVAKKRRISRLVFSIIALIAISAIAYTAVNLDGAGEFNPAAYYTDGQALVGGGFVGSVIAFGIIKVFGTVGLFIIAIAVFALYLTYFIARDNGTVAKFFYAILSSVTGLFASVEKSVKKSVKSRKAAKEEKNRLADDERRQDLYCDEYFAVDNGMQELSINELGIKEKRSRSTVEINPTLSETVYHKSAVNEEPAKEYTSDDGVFYSDGTITVKMSSDNKRRSSEDKKKGIDLDYATEYAQAAKEEAGEDAPRSNQASRSASTIGIDEDAESVFTKAFDPFDFVLGEKLASRPSSKSAEMSSHKESEGIGVFSESISNLTEEEVEKARRKADFEMRKKMIIERENAYRRKLEENAARDEAASRVTEEVAGGDETSRDNTGFAESASSVREPEPDNTVFKPYTPPKAPESEKNAFSEDSGTMRIERSMLEPEPIESEASPAEDFSVGQDMSFGGNDTATFDNEPVCELSEDNYDKDEPSYSFTENVTEARSGCEFIFEEDEKDEGELSEITEEPEEESFPDGFGEPIPKEEQNEHIFEQRKMFSIFSDDVKEDEPRDDMDMPGVTVSDYSEDDVDYTPESENFSADGDDDEPPFDFERRAPAIVVKEEPKKSPKPDYSAYKLPPIDLLGVEDNGGNDETNSETAENANKLIETLASFNVTASIKGFDRGPRITRYEVVPARGVKVSSIMNLFDDIALNLAAEGIRMEAPIPGKSAVGVEIPNNRPYTVRLRSLLETEEFASARSKTVVCMGKDVAGQPVFGDIAKMPHVLIAGATGMGKSVCINSLLLSMLYKAKPDEVKFIMIDPKKVEFNIYNGIPHLLIPVVTDPKQAAGALMWAVEQMEKRYDLIEQARVRNIEAYNAKVLENPEMGEPMPKIVIVVDELADLMLQVKNPVEGLIMSIAQKARAAGIHLIIGTQRPSVDIITGVIKANIPSRISCKVMSNADSRTILDMAGAEKLLDKGDMLFNPAGASRPKRVQGAFVSDSEVENIIEFIKAQVNGSVYDEQALEEINRAAQKCSKDKSAGGGRGYDEEETSDGGLYNNREFLDAVEVAVSSGKISTSLLQRKLSIGFGKAAKFIDGMEDLGIVSGPNGQKPRDVLITKDEWHEKLARVSLD